MTELEIESTCLSKNSDGSYKRAARAARQGSAKQNDSESDRPHFRSSQTVGLGAEMVFVSQTQAEGDSILRQLLRKSLLQR
jgi:hypothetical protein